MAECECLEACPFFNDKMKDQPAMTKLYKKKYCLTDNGKFDCARYKVRNALGKEKVPVDLYPNQTERAEMLIAENQIIK